MAASAAIQALTICLSRANVSSSTRAAASRLCSGLAQRPGLGHTLSHQDLAHSTFSRRQAAYQVVEAGQASGAPSGSGASGGSGGSAGQPAWQRMVGALDKKQPEAAYREFMQLLERGILPPNAVCDRLISALCMTQRFREARRAYAAVTPAGYCLQYNTYQALISAALKTGDLEAALDTFRDLQSLGLTANVVTYCGLISALGKERRRGVRYAQTAHELWAELAGSGAQLDGAAYRTGIKACVDVGRLKEGDKLLQRMAAAGLPADVRAYNILLAGHGRAGNPAAMDKLLGRMTSAGVRPSSVTFNTLVDGYVRARNLAAAEGVLARAMAAGVALDAWTYSTLIKGHVQAGKLAAAERVLGDMAAAGVRPTTVTFTTLIDGHVRAADMPAAQRVLEAMLAAGEAPNAITYNTLLRGYATLAVGNSASGTGASSSASNGSGSGSSSAAAAAPVAAVAAAATATAAAGSETEGEAGAAAVAAAAEPAAPPLGAALALLREMGANGVAPTVDTFNTLIAAAVAAGDCQLAMDLHGRLRAAGLRADGLTYTTLVQAHGRLGQVAEAGTAFEALLRDRSASVDVRSYNAMVDALARNGDMQAAEAMLTTACEMANRQGLPPPVEAFGAVVTGYARQLAVAPAVAVVRRFHAAGGSPDAQMLDILANIAIRAGDYKVAMQSVRALELIGRDVDKAKYAALLEEVRERQAEAAAAADRPQHNRTWRAYQKRVEARQKNVQLERFKFWLGLPNQYYADSSIDDGPSSTSYGSGSGEGWEWDSWGEEDRRRRQWRQS